MVNNTNLDRLVAECESEMNVDIVSATARGFCSDVANALREMSVDYFVKYAGEESEWDYRGTYEIGKVIPRGQEVRGVAKPGEPVYDIDIELLINGELRDSVFIETHTAAKYSTIPNCVVVEVQSKSSPIRYYVLITTERAREFRE